MVEVGGVEEVDAEVDGAVDDASGHLLALHGHVVAADDVAGDFEAGLAECSHRHRGVGKELVRAAVLRAAVWRKVRRFIS